jgi:hypothetical protein
MPSVPDPILHLQGREQRPLIVLDDFWGDPHALREDAASLKMGQIGRIPGVRAAVPTRLAETMPRRLAPLLALHFGVDPAPAASEAYYSLVTTSPADRAPIQRLPHFDGVEASRIAVLLFLGEGEQGGTAFYRQRATGFESVDADRLDRFKAELEGVRARMVCRRRRISRGIPQYEQIACQPARFNRALVYAGNTLHCAYLPPARTWSRRSTRRGCRAITPRSVGIA